MKKIFVGLLLMVFLLTGVLPLQELFANEAQVNPENTVIASETAGNLQESTEVEKNLLLTEKKTESLMTELPSTTDIAENAMNKAAEITALPKAPVSYPAVSPRSQSAGRDVSHLVTSLRAQPREVYDGGDVSVYFDFAEGAENIKSGDIIKISWPSGGEVFFEGYQTRKMLSVQNKDVAALEVTPTGATITFNSNVNDLEDVRGWGEFTAKARNLTDTSEASSKVGSFIVGKNQADVTVKKGEAGITTSFYYKSGDIQANDSEKVRWFLNINNTQVDVEEGIDVIDDIQEGQSLLLDSFDITVRGKEPQSAEGTKSYSGIHAIRDFEAAYPTATIKVNANANHLEVFIPQQYARFNSIVIMYKTKITNPSLKELKNNSNITYKEYYKERVYQKAYNISVNNVFADGGVTGAAKGELKVHKILEASSVGIPEVQFELTRKDGEEIAGEVNGEAVRGKKIILTTDINGVLSIKRLAETTYLLKEIHAPQWIDFKPSEAGTQTFEMKPNETKGVEFSVVNKRKTTNVQVTKKWTGITTTPPTTYVRLYRDGKPLEDEEGAKIIPLLPDQTTHEWKKLPISDEKGNLFHYEVKEVNEDGTMVAENEGEIAIQQNSYKVLYEDDQKKNETDGKIIPQDNIHVTITNTKVIPQKTTHVTVTKKWVGISESKPTTFVRLYCDGQVIDDDKGQVVALKAGKMGHEWVNLPLYKADGQVYEYSVKEVSEDGETIFEENQAITLAGERYRVHYDAERLEEQASHIVITNTKLTKVKVEKAWKGIQAQEAPVTYVQLFRDNIPQKAAMALENATEHEWTDLPMMREDGTPYDYTVKEVTADGGRIFAENEKITLSDGIYKVHYEPTIIEGDRQACHILNTKMTDVKVTKQWEGVKSAEAPAIRVYLVKNGERTAQSVILSRDNRWHDVFGALPVEENGRTIQYDVEEEVPQGYTMMKQGTAEAGFVITNKKQTPPVISEAPQTKIELTKKWQGIAPEKAPTIVVYLLKNGVRTGDKKELGHQNQWHGVFENLSTMEQGRKIEYDVEEIVPDGYRMTKECINENHYVLTNVKENKPFVPSVETPKPETINITVDKVWKGIDKDVAPAVTVYLLKNGKRTEEKRQLDKAHQWRATFTNLPRTEDGKSIVYDVEEVDVPVGYTMHKSGNMHKGFALENKKETVLEKDVLNIRVEKKWIGKAQKQVTVLLLAEGKKIDSYLLNQENDWTYYFKNLPKTDSDGRLIEYRVEEEKIAGYRVSITGSADKGFVITNTAEQETSLKTPSDKNSATFSKKTGIPATGDSQSFGWLLVLLCVSSFLLVSKGYRHRKREE